MPPITRKTVLDALFTVLQGAAGFNYFGRKLDFWTEQAEQPALFQRYVGEHRLPLHAYGIPQETVLNVEIWVYVKAGNPGQDAADYPELYITPLLDNIDNALIAGTTFDGRQTLGLDGYVTHAWIEGEMTVSQGEGGDSGQCVCIIPVKVQVNAQLGAVNAYAPPL